MPLMPVNVLLADDSALMQTAICRLLGEEPAVKVVAVASSFAETMQMIADHKPDVLLLDLHLPEKRFTPTFVRSQLVSVPHVLAISVSNDEEAQDLAKGYGATQLLDKMTLFDDLIPAIMIASAELEF